MMETPPFYLLSVESKRPKIKNKYYDSSDTTRHCVLSPTVTPLDPDSSTQTPSHLFTFLYRSKIFVGLIPGSSVTKRESLHWREIRRSVRGRPCMEYLNFRQQPFSVSPLRCLGLGVDGDRSGPVVLWFHGRPYSGVQVRLDLCLSQTHPRGGDGDSPHLRFEFSSSGRGEAESVSEENTHSNLDKR